MKLILEFYGIHIPIENYLNRRKESNIAATTFFLGFM